MVPVVVTFTAAILNIFKMRRAIFKHDFCFQLSEDLLSHRAVDANRILTLNFIRWMHQAIGQFTVGGEQQQAAGIDIKTTDADPTCTTGLGQMIKNGSTAFGITACADFAFRLVIHDDTRFFLLFLTHGDTLAVYMDPVARLHPVTQGAGIAINLDSTLFDPAFDFTARTKAHARQYFLYAFFGHQLINRKGILATAVPHNSYL